MREPHFVQMRPHLELVVGRAASALHHEVILEAVFVVAGASPKQTARVKR
jgi:hypothetical protein